jgi:putative PIN family toxin of toxin-antitoxin system
MKPPGIVIDTNIIIAALRSQRGASALLLSLIGTGRFEIHISIPLALEYEEVLLRQRDELGLSADEVEGLVDSLCAVAICHERIYFTWRPSLPDERDEHILDLAVKGECSAIITYNIRDFGGVEQQFGIRIISPQTFLHEIGVIQ